MSRYINAGALIERWNNMSVRGRTEFDQEIMVAPSIDIVRCGECIHNPWNTDYDYTCIWDDDFADRPQTPDDFCSYGEREGE